MKAIMGTGSRSMLTAPNAREIYENLKAHILHLKEIEPDHHIILISGMAEGWDEAIAKIGMREGIEYHVYIPTKDYGNYYWGQHSLLGVNRMEMFNQLVDGAARVTYLEDIYGQPRFMRRHEIDQFTIAGPNYNVGGLWLHANMARNRVMVDNCRGGRALVYDSGSAGTRDAVARLKQARLAYEVYPFKASLF
jgi:hypothetical protein